MVRIHSPRPLSQEFLPEVIDRVRAELWRENWIADLWRPMRIVRRAAGDTPTSQPATAAPVVLTGADNVGALLREARERRGIPLERLAQITRIRASILHAIESNDIEALPQDVFLRGFLRAYAKEVGLDPEEAVRRYFDQFQAVDDTVESSTAPVENPSEAPAEPELNWPALRNLAAVVLIAVLTLVYAAGRWHTRPRTASSAPTPSSAPAPSETEEIAQSYAQKGTAGSSVPAPVAAAGRVLHMELRTTADCWVAATVDGTQLVYKLLPAGEHRAFDVKQDAVLRIGNPAALDLSIDGKPARALGTAGQAVTARITGDNFHAFLKQ